MLPTLLLSLIMGLNSGKILGQDYDYETDHDKENQKVNNGSVQFGIKAGLNIADFRGDLGLDTAPVGTTASEEFNFGFSAGFLLYLPVNIHMGIQVEGLYSLKGNTTTLEGGSPNVKLGVDFNLGYIDIPFLLRLNVENTYFLLGPSVGILTSAKGKVNLLTPPPGVTEKTYCAAIDGCEVDIKSDTNGTDFGLVFGIGFNLNGLILEARYSLGLTEIDKSPESGDEPFYNKVIQFMVGYAFNI